VAVFLTNFVHVGENNNKKSKATLGLGSIDAHHFSTLTGSPQCFKLSHHVLGPSLKDNDVLRTTRMSRGDFSDA
jgi:hypothetical protein